MASSSKHNTAVEKQIQSLCLLVFARLEHSTIPVMKLSHLMDRFVATLDIDTSWLHRVTHNDLSETKDESEDTQITEFRELVTELEAQGTQMTASMLLEQIANACDDLTNLLRGVGRDAEAVQWSRLAADCQAGAEQLRDAEEEEIRQRLGHLRL